MDIQEGITGTVNRGRKGKKQAKQLQHIEGDIYEYQSLTPSASVFKSSGTFVPGTYICIYRDFLLSTFIFYCLSDFILLHFLDISLLRSGKTGSLRLLPFMPLAIATPAVAGVLAVAEVLAVAAVAMANGRIRRSGRTGSLRLLPFVTCLLPIYLC